MIMISFIFNQSSTFIVLSIFLFRRFVQIANRIGVFKFCFRTANSSTHQLVQRIIGVAYTFVFNVVYGLHQLVGGVPVVAAFVAFTSQSCFYGLGYGNNTFETL